MIRRNRITGFTLVEVIVVIAVSVLLTTLLITFNRSSEKVVVLRNEQATLINALLMAKSFSIQTFIEEQAVIGDLKVCGYGVHVEGNGYVLFIDTPNPDPINSECVDSSNQYTGNRQFDAFEIDPRFTFMLDSRAEFSNLPGGVQGFDVVFVPPEPTTTFFPGNPNEVTFDIKLVDDSDSVTIHMSRAGQITTQ